MPLKGKKLKFVGIKNYLALQFSYDNFLKAQKCEMVKGHFPYEWLNSYEKSSQARLPAHADFYSHLRNGNISNDDSNSCRRFWTEHAMSTMRLFALVQQPRCGAICWSAREAASHISNEDEYRYAPTWHLSTRSFHTIHVQKPSEKQVLYTVRWEGQRSLSHDQEQCCWWTFYNIPQISWSYENTAEDQQRPYAE